MGLFIGSSLCIRQAIARNRLRARAEQRRGWSKPRRGGARKGGRRSPRNAQRGCIERRACAPRRATDLLYREAKAGLAAPGEAEPPRDRLSQTRNAAYDAARFAARVISSFRYALKNTMFRNSFGGSGPLSLFARGCSDLLLCLRRGFWRRRGAFRLFFFLGG